MDKRERIEEEFELESEEIALRDYSHITCVISVNYCLMADELSKFGEFQEGVAVDLGCGLGDLAIEVARRHLRLTVIGVDISLKAITEAAKRAKEENLDNVRFELQDVHRLGFADNSIDLAVSHGSIHHWRDAAASFSEIYRVLKPGGLAYLNDLRRDAPQEIVEEVKTSLPPSQAKGFINSIQAAYIPEELRTMLSGLGIRDFEVSEQKFSRETIFKNIGILRRNSSRSADYNKLSQSILIRKSQVSSA